jgi:DnaJ-class molecular chaperone
MKDYYKILDIKSNCIKNNILKAYIFQISRFNDLPFLTIDMIKDIKEYKTAYYILIDNERREKYNKTFFNNSNEYNTKINDRLFSLKNN